MASFPTIENCSIDALLQGASKNSTANWITNNLGTGYVNNMSFGLNPIRPEWDLAWEVSPADASTIDAFLQARGDDAAAFQWQPPDSNSELDWVCPDWSITQISYNWYQVKAKFYRVFELSEDLASESLECDPQTLPPVTGYWFRYANNVQTSRRYGIAGFADTDNSVYTLGININTTYHYVGKIDADTAVATWNKRYSYSDSGTFLMNSQYTESSVVDDENGTDGTVSLFSHKAGTSSIRIYRVVISKVDGSVVNTFTAEINVLKDGSYQPCVVRKVGENYIVFILATGNVPNPCGGVLNQTDSTLMGSFTPSMSCNWLNILGTAFAGFSGTVGGITYDSSVYPKGNEPRFSSDAVPYYFDFDDTYIYITNGDRTVNTNSGYGNHFIKLSIATGAGVSGPGAYTDPDSSRYILSNCCALSSDGSVYTDAGSSFSTVGNVDIIKWSSNAPAWYRNYNFGGSETNGGQKVIERDGKLLLTYAVAYSTGAYELRICLVNPSDGSVVSGSGKIINWDGSTPKNIEPLNMNVVPMANPSGVLIITQVGTYIRLDVNNLPAAGSYSISDDGMEPSGDSWVVTDIAVTSSTKTTSAYISLFPRVYCNSLPPGDTNMPTVFNVLGGVTLTNPTVTTTAEDNPTFGVDRIGGYYSS